MSKKPHFCPNASCKYHNPEAAKKAEGKIHSWYKKNGSYNSKKNGIVQTYVCLHCGKAISDQTFKITYHTKRNISYQKILQKVSEGVSIRSMSRDLHCSTATIQNRISRLAPQLMVAMYELFCQSSITEDVALDGFESFIASQYHPNNINLAVTTSSRLLLAFSYTAMNRKGKMTDAQKKKTARLKELEPLEKNHIKKTFSELLHSLKAILPEDPSNIKLITDKKKEYVPAIKSVFPSCEHIRVDSRLPRDCSNLLYPVNYYDREMRKDLCEHHRETMCFGKDVNSQLERLVLYQYAHNFLKKFRANDSVSRNKISHAIEAGIDPSLIRKTFRGIFTYRKFHSQHTESAKNVFLEKLWGRSFKTPEKPLITTTPKYVLG